MTWNHRVTKETLDNGEAWYSVREVFYKDGKPVSWTKDSIAAEGESLEEVVFTLNSMIESIEKYGILDLDALGAE